MEISKEVMKELTSSLVTEEIKKMKDQLAPSVRLAILDVFKSKDFKKQMRKGILDQLSDIDFLDHMTRKEYENMIRTGLKSVMKF